MLVKIGCLISVIILAVITQHVIGWAGSILHQIGDTGQNYALFVFMDDRHQPMTNNILMNIFIPNIVSVFLYIVLQKLSVSNITIWVGLYVLFYFVYRFILICVILRRKELYTIRYEWGMAVSSLIICLLLICFFFGKNNNLLISVNDLKEELWFAILLIIYTFIKNILDSKVKQDDVLTRRQLEKYINNNFEILYRRYHRELNITREDRQVWLIIFSIMIFENFNRGAMLRWLERLKLKVVGHATVGIMQVSSDKVLTDMESILEAYERIIKFGEELNIDFSDELLSLFLNDLLMKYNPDENYASSVTYIYQCLYSFVYDNEPYCRDFGLGKNDTPICEVDKMEKKIIRCGSIREVVWKLKDYTEIHMRSAVYNILDGMEENEHIRVDREYDGWRVRFCNLHNFVIDGENSEWFSPFTQCTVLFFENCSNFEIRNLKIGKEKTEQSQDGSVLCESCDSIVIENVNLFGGISLVECYDIRLKNVCLQKSIQEESLIYVDSMICMENVEICNCYTEGAIIDTCGEKLDCQNVYIHDNQYRKNPNTLSTVGGIIWDRNEQLPWF